jgi:hypothetical protein
MSLKAKDFKNSKSWYNSRTNYTSFYDANGNEWVALSTNFSEKGTFELSAPSGACIYMTEEQIAKQGFKSRFN